MEFPPKPAIESTKKSPVRTFLLRLSKNSRINTQFPEQKLAEEKQIQQEIIGTFSDTTTYKVNTHFPNSKLNSTKSEIQEDK